MRCSVVTVVSAICLAGHLLVGVGHAHVLEDTLWSEAAEFLPSPVLAKTHEPSVGKDGMRPLSQLAAKDEGGTSPLTWKVTTAASLGFMPAAPEQLAFKGDVQEDFVTMLPEDIATTPKEDNFTAPRENILNTTQKYVAAMPEGDDDLVRKPILVDGRVPTRYLQLVICACPIPTPDECRRFLSDLHIDGKDNDFLDMKKPVTDLSVVVHNVTCEKEDHRFMNFSEGQFYLRDRGDLVLRNVGYLEGLRVNDYCADPRKDKRGYIKWTIKVCVPPPSVPRCCPSGQALRNGKCEAANTPAVLQPPMSAGMHEPSIYWPVIKNHNNTMTCPSDPLAAIPLVPEDSYLLAVPSGLVHIWHPSDAHVINKFTYSPDFCVDGHVDASGSVRYTANFCYTRPEEFHHQVCDGHICVRKCCKDNEEMSLSLYRCIPSNTTTYTPHFTVRPDDYRIVNGFPLCEGHVLVNYSTVDSRGYLQSNGENFNAREYCVDKFKNGLGEVVDMAKVCIKNLTAWTKARQTALPICQIISLVFLTLTVGCYCVVPELLQGGGWYHLFFVLSLMLGYASLLAQMFNRHWTTGTCFAMGIVLQFGFLSTFFWLNVLCFEVWRKIRSLNNYRATSIVPVWAYLLYAFGMPTTIGALTMCMEFFAPDDVPGVVKPSLAKTKCFFDDPLPLFLYFYGPIAFLFLCNIVFIIHTYWTFRKFEQNNSALKRYNTKSLATMKTSEQIRDYMSDIKQEFFLLGLMSACWVTEVLSWVIPPPELWSVTDLLNSLQGFFIFVIFIASRTNRKHLKKGFYCPSRWRSALEPLPE